MKNKKHLCTATVRANCSEFFWALTFEKKANSKERRKERRMVYVTMVVRVRWNRFVSMADQVLARGMRWTRSAQSTVIIVGLWQFLSSCHRKCLSCLSVFVFQCNPFSRSYKITVLMENYCPVNSRPSNGNESYYLENNTNKQWLFPIRQLA